MTTTAEPIDTPPDWSGQLTDLTCPLCDYNLRGLTEPRCPECGFAFRWSELLDGQRLTHPYLFEHQPKRNLWSFWKTYWADCWPRTFWATLNPAQPVKPRRLLIYWFLANTLMMLLLIASLTRPVMQLARVDEIRRHSPLAIRTGYYNPLYNPKPWSPGFFFQVAYNIGNSGMGLTRVRDGLMVMAWTWFTLPALLVFQISMRRAKIKSVHVLRAAIYGCDFGVLLILLRVFIPDATRGAAGLLSLATALVCAGVATYRITFAYSKYLRFHLPFATVVASQVMVLVLVIALLFQNIRFLL